jgi:1-acyl-sn-glycerol-3-phosphate acyltransferase
MIRFLNGGEGVVVFPEGTYYNDKMGPGHVGIIRLILSRLRLPFIPVGIRYYKGLIRTKVRVRFGRAIYSDPADPPTKLVDNIMETIADLSDLPKRE